MLKVGGKAMIVGANTPEGRRWIGSMVEVHQLLNDGDKIDPSIIRLPPHIREIVGDFSPTWWQGAGAVVFKEGLVSTSPIIAKDYALFKQEHLMPIEPLEDPGIDECTFTPIIQKETA